ncbi:hypothetical protein BJ741DRAFT_625605 [Chytriomyces cf. hyalinus JEL632]|nr:hypothetical protein BJ741DRAFT_625605 [Chytriomyces cf. hyalinus JEL632]
MSKLYDFENVTLPATSSSAAVNANEESSNKQQKERDKKPVVPAGWTTGTRLMAPVRRPVKKPNTIPVGAAVASTPTATPASAKLIVRKAQGLEPAAATPSPSQIYFNSRDEYDPSKPNEYDVAKADAKRRRKEAKLAKLDARSNSNRELAKPSAQLDAHMHANNAPVDFDALQRQRLSNMSQSAPNHIQDITKDSSMNGEDEDDEDDEDDDVDGIPMNPSILVQTSTTSFAPSNTLPQPPSRPAMPAVPSEPSAVAQTLLADATGDDAYLRRMQMSNAATEASPVQQTPWSQSQKSRVSTGAPPPSFAAPFSMGVKESPVSVQHSNWKHSTTVSAPASMTRVVLLQNMVGHGQVDDELKDETAAECSKFGPVERVEIYEAKRGSVRAEEAVSIFVKFKTSDAAMEAKSKMDGRFFGGRQVRAIFFPEARFDAGDLRV